MRVAPLTSLWVAFMMAETERVTKKKKGRGHFCSAINCTNSFYKPECAGLCFFRFPPDKERCRRWIQNSRREDLISRSAKELSGCYKLCSIHFEPNQFNRPADRDRLVWDAVPTLFDLKNPPPKVTSKKRSPKHRSSTSPPAKSRRKQESEPVPDVDRDDTPPIPELPDNHSLGVGSSGVAASAKKLRSARNKVYYRNKKLVSTVHKKESVAAKKARLIKDLHSLLPAPTASFVESRLWMIGKKKRGHRWNEKDKTIALSLFHASRKAYRLLNKLFVLPSISTLRKAVRAVNIFPGFNDSILQALQQKLAAMPEDARLCTLVFDEMCLKEKVVYNKQRDNIDCLEDCGHLGRSMFVANHATVFLVHGIVRNWKQPFGYLLSSGTIKSSMLSTLICECVEKLTAIGLKVKCVIADQGSNNPKAFKDGLKVTEDKLFFVQDGIKIHVLFDPPHLLKNIRNNLGRRINTKVKIRKKVCT